MRLKLIIPVLFLVLFSCCFIGWTKKNIASINSSANILMKTDQDFSKMSVEKGMKAAFLAYAADDAIRLRQMNHPDIGKKSIELSLSNSDSNSVMKWTPVKADISSSSDLGYTFGNWEYKTNNAKGKEEVIYGNYITVWRKEKDGKWKFVADGGTQTPPPVKK